MAVVKIVLKKDKKLDGTYPLVIRITKDRKSSFVYLNHSINDRDWDSINERVKKSHPNSTKLNNFLFTKKAEALNETIDLEADKKHVTAKVVRKKLVPKSDAMVFAQADLYIQRLEDSRKYNRFSADKSRVKHLKEFFKQQDIPFQDLTVSVLNRFKTWLKTEYKMSERSAINHLVVVRSIFSQAINDEKVCEAKHYPFGKGKIQIKFPDSLKVGGNTDDLAILEKIDLSNDPSENHARNVWLFSFYFAGMRVSDVFRLKWSDFQNNRLFYSMGKNNKGDSLKIPDKAQKILDQYISLKDDTDLVFPELKSLDSLDDPFIVQKRIKTRLKVINDDLVKVAKKAGINKKLTMHISRHTFGNISGDKIPVQMLQKLYRHTSITTTIGYQSSFINKSADDALDAVIGN